MALCRGEIKKILNNIGPNGTINNYELSKYARKTELLRRERGRTAFRRGSGKGMKQWKVITENGEAARRLRREAELSPVLARLLVARGLSSAEEAQAFLQGEDRFSPFSFAGMAEAAERIHRALDDFEGIAIYGDYDADGVTATAMLYSYLESCGANITYYIPDREAEGYGLNCAAIDVLQERGASLIVTVDNGVSSIAEVEYAASLGIDVVVTDHHRPRPELPAACAVVDPHRADCPSGCRSLSGVGVAFELILALEGEDCDVQGLLDNYADLVCIGTIGDVVPLIGENRTFVREGLRLIGQTDRLGLRALMECAGMADRTLTSINVAFTIVPRINATGRIGSPDRAVRLLLTEDPEEAEELAEEICRDNDTRRRIESEIFDAAMEQLRREPERLLDRVLIVQGQNWHHGVIGIVASRITERFGKPCFVLSVSGEEAKGSGRSVEGFDLFRAVSSCADLLSKYGGHPMAAGLSLAADRVEELRRKINQYACSLAPVLPALTVDCLVAPQEITLELADELALLEPVGTGNPPPLFGLFDASIAEISPIGGGKHLRLTVTKNGCPVRCVRFSVTQEEFPYRVGDQVDLALSVEAKEYMGSKLLSVCVRELRPAGADTGELLRSRIRYEEARRGEALSPAVWQELYPTRDDFARLYRFLRSANGYQGDAAVLWSRLGGTTAFGKLLLCLDVLAEHRLIRLEALGDLLQVGLLPAAGKTDLFSSRLLSSLRKSE